MISDAEDVARQLLSDEPGIPIAPAVTPPPAAPPTPDPAAETQRLMAEREAAWASERAQWQAQVQTANAAAQSAAQAVQQSLAAQREREAALYAQAAAQQTVPQPSKEQWQELVDNPDRLGAYLEQRDAIREQRLLQQLAPYANQVGALTQSARDQALASQRNARNEAGRIVKDKLGFDDFDQLFPEVEQQLLGTAPNLLGDPEAIADAIVLLKRRKGTLVTVKAPTPPPTADPRPGVLSGDTRAQLSTLGPMWREMGAAMGLDPNAQISESDLERVAHLVR